MGGVVAGGRPRAVRSGGRVVRSPISNVLLPTSLPTVPVPGQRYDPYEQTRLRDLLDATPGRPNVVVGVIDGPVDASHAELARSRLRFLSAEGGECAIPRSDACLHGTFVAGMLCTRRDSGAPALCPGCTVLVRPLFCEAERPGQCPDVSPGDLAAALTDVVDAGARVVNMSLGLATTALGPMPELDEACEYAYRRGALVVCAAGNGGHVGSASLFAHGWVIPVAACDEAGRPLPASNLGRSVGRRGLLAPGRAITSTAPGGGMTSMSGTSVSAPWVTGTAALLWSLAPHAPATAVRRALLRPDRPRRSIVPPLLDGESGLQALQPWASRGPEEEMAG